MKWGVRRFQNPDGTLTPAGKDRYRHFKNKMKGSEIQNKYDHDGSSKSKFVSRQLKTALVSVMTLNPVGAVFIAKDTVSALASNAKEKRAIKKQSMSPIDKKTGLHIKTNKKCSKRDDLKSVNPGFADFSDNTKNNCMLCTTAYDLRRRGYDVLAKKAVSGYGSDFIEHCYPKAKKHVPEQTITTKSGETKISNKVMRENTKKDLLAQGDGARGNLCVTWKKGNTGHSMAYEVENGKVTIYDAQCGKTFSLDSILSKSSGCYTYRLDNVDFDKKAIKDAVR